MCESLGNKGKLKEYMYMYVVHDVQEALGLIPSWVLFLFQLAY